MSDTLHLQITGRDWLKKLGISLALATPWSLMALEMAKRGAVNSQAIAQVLAWGPAFLVLVGLYLIIERWAPRAIETQKQSVAAQQQLADAVRQMVERGDRDARETLGMLRYTNSQVERMHAANLDQFQRIFTAIEEIKHGQ